IGCAAPSPWTGTSNDGCSGSTPPSGRTSRKRIGAVAAHRERRAPGRFRLRQAKEPRAQTPERAAPTLARTRPCRALRVQLWTEPRGQAPDNFKLSTVGSFLCKSRRLVGGGNSHQRTILHRPIPYYLGKYGEFSQIKTSLALIRCSKRL